MHDTKYRRRAMAIWETERKQAEAELRGMAAAIVQAWLQAARRTLRQLSGKSKLS